MPAAENILKKKTGHFSAPIENGPEWAVSWFF
jgi:hypothetical protein